MEHDKKTHAIEHFRKGCTWAEVATACGIARTTLWRWARTDQEFAVAIQEAKAEPDIDVEAVTFQNACDPDPAHNTLRMFWLKSRMPRTYRERLDVTSERESAKVVLYMPDNGRNNGTVIKLPYKEGEAVPRQETDIAPSPSSPEARQVEPDL